MLCEVRSLWVRVQKSWESYSSNLRNYTDKMLLKNVSHADVVKTQGLDLAYH